MPQSRRSRDRLVVADVNGKKGVQLKTFSEAWPIGHMLLAPAWLVARWSFTCFSCKLRLAVLVSLDFTEMQFSGRLSVKNLLMAVGIALFAALGSLHAFAQSTPPGEASRKAELDAAWQAASKAGTKGPSEVALIDQASLKLPANYFFIPKAEAARVLRALGNVVNDANLNGIVVGQRQSDRWIVVIRYVKEGYIKDDDAKNWNADELLNNLREGVEESNKDRAARGFPELQLIGWVEPPTYDAMTHRLVWSVLGKDKGQPDALAKNINYNTYALGRDGYFSLNLLSSSDRIANEKSVAHELLADLSYNVGKRYEDFSATTDRIAAYGLAALIGGVAVKKLGLLALAGAFILKFAKLILIGVAAVGALVMKLFRRKPPNSSAAA
jgi:uncharacterized membrane-anchored protein